MKVGIHQSNFMPWVGYFKKIKFCDKFVFLENVKCSKNSFFNRNRFSTSKKRNDYFWLTCPLSKTSYKQNLSEVECNSDFLSKHIKHFKLRYRKTNEKQYLEELLSFYESTRDEDKVLLSNFNKNIIAMTCKYLDIETEIISSLNIKNINKLKKQDLVIGIVKALSGKVYISGQGAKDYQDEKYFNEAGIELKYLRSDYSKVSKISNEHVSIVDIILQEGIWKTKKMILH